MFFALCLLLASIAIPLLLVASIVVSLILSGLLMLRLMPAPVVDERDLVLALQIDPEPGAGAEVAPETNGGVGRDGAASVQNVGDPARWHRQIQGQAIRAQAAGFDPAP